MTPISCEPETPAWEVFRRSYRRRMAVWRAMRIGACAVALAVIFGTGWYALVIGALYYL